jgi:cyclopropane fatty-acyl-phospholipid synthase-like methyltransferase
MSVLLAFYINVNLLQTSCACHACTVQACEQLAQLAGDAIQLQQTDTVLDVACGAGDSLLLWRSAYGVQSVSGLEIVPCQVSCFSCLAYLKASPEALQVLLYVISV